MGKRLQLNLTPSKQLLDRLEQLAKRYKGGDPQRKNEIALEILERYSPHWAKFEKMKQVYDKEELAKIGQQSLLAGVPISTATPAEPDISVPCIWDGKPSEAGICTDCLTDLVGTAKITQGKLNDLPYGAIALNEAGTILAYNKAESEMARISHRQAIGKNFFTQIAPCAEVQDFHQRYDDFLRGDRAKEEFNFTYRFKHGVTHVLITFMRVDEKRALVTTKKLLEQSEQSRGQG